MRDFSIDLVWAKIQMGFAAIGGWLGYFLGGVDGLLITLLVFVALDYVTGVMCAIIDKKLSSEAGFKGLFRKVLIFALVGVAHILDVNVIGTGSAFRSAVICFYLSNEGVSILKKMELAIHMNATMALDQSAYQKDYDVLLEQAASTKAQVDGLEEVIAKKDKQRRKLLRVMSEIEKRDSLLSAFDEPLWIAIVEKVVVSTKELIFFFRDGTQRAVKRE